MGKLAAGVFHGLVVRNGCPCAIVMMPDADLVGSATLVTVIVIVLDDGAGGGAVYKPAAEIVPSTGLSDHVRAVFEVFAMVAVNAWGCEGIRVTLAGVSVTLTGGASATLALAETEESAMLVAVTAMVCAAGMEAGAV